VEKAWISTGPVTARVGEQMEQTSLEVTLITCAFSHAMITLCIHNWSERTFDTVESRSGLGNRPATTKPQLHTRQSVVHNQEVDYFVFTHVNDQHTKSKCQTGLLASVHLSFLSNNFCTYLDLELKLGIKMADRPTGKCRRKG
jgi:hypothetical protein